MAERKLEKLNLDPEEFKLMCWKMVKNGFLEMDDEEVEIFEKYQWKLFVSMIGYKMIENYKHLINGECIINFFPGSLDEFNEVMSSQNTTYMGQQLIKPIFYIKFNKDHHIEVIDRSENKIPKKIAFAILCR